MNIIISDTSDSPIYQQIFEQLRGQILRGELASGTPIPPIRTVAKELRISVITVKKAWELLEGGGLITTRVGRGSFVSGLSEDELRRTRQDLLSSTMADDVARYKQLGYTKKEILETIQNIIEKEG